MQVGMGPAESCEMRNSCEGCKRYWNHLHGKKVTRFVRRMNRDCRQSLVIPERFVNHFVGKMPGTVKLEGPSGNVYDVDVTEHRNITILRSGWEVFVDANNVVEKDSLVFRYQGSSRFKVAVFDSGGCEKRVSCAGIESTFSDQEPDTNSTDMSSSSSDHDTDSSVGRRSDGCQSESSGHCRKCARTDTTSSPSEDLSGEHSASECDSSESENVGTPNEDDYVLSVRSYLAEAQKEEVVMLLREIQPRTPPFVAVMRKSSVEPPYPSLIISKAFAVVHFPHESGSVTLQRPGVNKKWHPRFYKRKDASMHKIRGQWVDFVSDNHVEEDDICIFVPAKGGRRFTFTVHLLRVESNMHAETTLSRDRTGGFQAAGSGKGKKDIKIEKSTDGENDSSESDMHTASDEPLESHKSHGLTVPPYILPFMSHLSSSQKKIVEAKVQAIQSEVPIYVSIMKKSNTENCETYFSEELGSRYVAAAHLPDENHTMMLQCKGEKWKAKMVVLQNGRRRFISGGWSKFARDNSLGVGDICLFEQKMNNKKLTMKVHIILSNQC
ncbi:unnamed protein product [Alopecurus aequalis]